MAPAKELDDLRWINRALADGEARIKKQREIVADLGLLGADRTRAKTVLNAMLSAQAERQRYREMLLREHHRLEWFAVCLALLWPSLEMRRPSPGPVVMAAFDDGGLVPTEFHSRLTLQKRG